MNKYLIVVVGPTAVGKTKLAVQLAKEFDTSVVSSDSRQFYKEMEIGTAKPTLEEMEGVPHYFVNSLSIKEHYDAGKFEKECNDLLTKLFLNKEVVVMAGGSGLFVKAAVEGFDDIPSAEPEIRNSLNRQFDQDGLESLLKELKEKDPVYYEKVDQKNPKRIIRALEVIRQTGSPYSEFTKKTKKQRPYIPIFVGLTTDREKLYKRINKRVDQMIENGLEEEASTFSKFKELPALQTVGYQEWYPYFNDDYDYNEAVRLIKRNSRRYAKRQLTWFSKNEKTKWFEPDQLQTILSYIKSEIR